MPDSALQQVFGRQRLSEKLCILAAEAGLINVETFAMLGDTIAGVKATLKTLVADETKLGDSAAAKELALNIAGSSLENLFESSGTLRSSSCKDGGRSFKSP